MRNKVFFFMFLSVFGGLPVQIYADDTAIAEKYFQWAQKAVDEGRWGPALIGLERALDFAECSSDISYLFAAALLHENQSRVAAFTAAKLAVETDKWRYYSREQGLLLQAELEIRLHRFQSALSTLKEVATGAEEALVRLLAYKGLEDWSGFTTNASVALEKYPRDVRIARILLETKPPSSLSEVYRSLIEKIFKRLPALLEVDPELAYIATPFITDFDEARRLVAAYRAVNEPAPASIAAALNLGVVDGETAIEELFRAGTFDKNLALSVWSLLRDNDSREQMRQNLLSYSGLITEDNDRDDCIETQVKYEDGRITEFSHDGDFDGVFDTVVSFENGTPIRARVKDIQVIWEQYPAVLDILVNGLRYVFKPNDFFFTPLKLNSIVGVLYPETTQTVLAERALITEALFIERDSSEFIGAVERIEIENGIPIRAREFLDERIVSETTFSAGKPVSEIIDLDLDGIMETKRVF
jgi:hypothetical protein